MSHTHVVQAGVPFGVTESHVDRLSGVREVSATRFAFESGLTEGYVERMCACGRFLGAYRHSLNRKWWLRLPLRLRFG